MAQVGAKVADFASGLKAVGLQTKGRVGVFGGNCPEWMIAMQASGSPVLCEVTGEPIKLSAKLIKEPIKRRVNEH